MGTTVYLIDYAAREALEIDRGSWVVPPHVRPPANVMWWDIHKHLATDHDPDMQDLHEVVLGWLHQFHYVIIEDEYTLDMGPPWRHAADGVWTVTCAHAEAGRAGEEE